MVAESSKAGKDYYNSGSTELATDTPLTLHRLEQRRKLTKNSNRLVIVLVGLPARGKSFVARKLLTFLEWYGCHCQIFNVGKYRRQAYASNDNESGACNADFFDSQNQQATALREQAAKAALEDMLAWLDEEDESSPLDASFQSNNNNNSFSQFFPTDNNAEDSVPPLLRRSTSSITPDPTEERSDRIAIFDATNSTHQRRQWILEECTSPEKRPGKSTGCVFVESICDDAELLMENFGFKISNSPDYKGMPRDQAMADLKARVQKYEEQYETITDDSMSYIKIFNLSTKLLVNHIYGRMSKIIVPALMAWNIGTRPIFLCRPGQTLSDFVTTDSDDYVSKIQHNALQSDPTYRNLSAHSQRRLMRGDSLGPGGKRFSDALYDFVFAEGMDFLVKRSSTMDMADTGTSISGLASIMDHNNNSMDDSQNAAPFPLKIFTSTMPRASETVRWDEYDFRVEEVSNLNPLDKGDFAGKELEELQTTHPAWYNRLEKKPFSTRFPGGESYKDLIGRLESIVVDLEQQVIPTLIVSHVSILQLLMAYFRKSPVETCMNIEVPLHTVIKFTPAQGGGWSETQHPLTPIYDHTPPASPDGTKMKIEGMDQLTLPRNKTSLNSMASPSPIWGDHFVRRTSSTLSVGGHHHKGKEYC